MRESHDKQRTQSARSNGGSRRRRWEVRSKESFETSLAVEVDEPIVTKTPRTRRECRKEQSPTGSESKNYYKENEQKKTHFSPPKGHRVDDPNDGNPDILTTKLSALIEEANTKTKHSGTHKASDEKQHTNGNYESPYSHEEGTDSDTYGVKDGKTNKAIMNTDKAQVLNDRFETKSLKVAESPKYQSPDKNYYKDSEKSDVHSEPTPEPSAPPFSPDTSEASPKKKKKSKKTGEKLLVVSGGDESYISLQLRKMDEDIIDINKEGEIGKLTAPGLVIIPSPSRHSGHINTIFREEMDGFVVAKQGNEVNRKKNGDLYDVNQIPTRSSHAVFLQSGFRTFSVFCQGLLAGIVVTHCLLIFLLDSTSSGLATMYTPVMAHVFFALILFLTTLCVVAACDRHDLLGLGVFSGHGIKIPWTPAFYISSLVLTLVAVRTENVLIGIHRYQDQIFSKAQIADFVEWWRWLCVARTGLAVLAWLAVSPDPHTDALLHAVQIYTEK